VNLTALVEQLELEARRYEEKVVAIRAAIAALGVNPSEGFVGRESFRGLSKENEIKRSVPYPTIAAEIPGLTLRDYNAAVEALATKKLNGSMLPPTAPPDGQSQVRQPPHRLDSSVTAVRSTGGRARRSASGRPLITMTAAVRMGRPATSTRSRSTT
jgi:hypothetical protein